MRYTSPGMKTLTKSVTCENSAAAWVTHSCSWQLCSKPLPLLWVKQNKEKWKISMLVYGRVTRRPVLYGIIPYLKHLSHVPHQLSPGRILSHVFKILNTWNSWKQLHQVKNMTITNNRLATKNLIYFSKIMKMFSSSAFFSAINSIYHNKSLLQSS